MRASIVITGSALIALAVAGCTAGPDEPAVTTPSAAAGTTFESLGIADWPADAELLDGVPAPPAELDAATYDRVTAAIAQIAELAARDEELRDLDDPLPELASRLQDPFARLVPLVAEQETAPRVTFLNYFGSGTEITAGPLMQHVWDVRPAADRAGTTITLQTWAAYEVTGDEGSGVIGVFREFNRTEADDGFTGATWETAGADTCALAVDDAIELDPRAEQLALLEAFALEGEQHTFAVREVDDSINEEFKAACLDEG